MAFCATSKNAQVTAKCKLETLQYQRIFVSTWNVGESKPLERDDFEKLLPSEGPVDIYAFGFQEIKTGAQETVKSFIKYDQWAKALIDFLSKRSYYLIESVRVQGISLSVFALINHLPHIRHIETEIERTGVAGAWGNKGGVAVSARVYGQHICFLNAHLSAHLTNDDGRISDVNEIYREMSFRGKATVQDHDLVLMFGDLNFRIDEYSRAFVLDSIKKKNYSELWSRDQLKKHMKSHPILSTFEEATLDFDPTYKYDPNTDIYDTSEKQRKPAWTDRVLWRIHPEFKAGKRAPNFTLTYVDQSFTNHAELKQSDHKPVSCEFDLKIKRTASHEPVIRIENEGEWACHKDGKIKMELCEGFSWASRDYVALYKHELRDFRTYHTYEYVPKAPDHRNESSDEESDEDRQRLDGRRLSRAANDDPNDNVVHHLDMRKSWITEPGIYRLGYYSMKMSCLVAISEPFEIK